MKRLSFLFLILLLVPLLFACTSKGENVDIEYEITGTITEIGETIEMEVDDGQNASGTYLVITGKETDYYNENGDSIKRNALNAGDHIKVTYNGQVTRSLPPQIFALKIQKISL
jgi:hypothetical protein